MEQDNRWQAAELNGLECTSIDNPYGSVLVLNFGPLALWPDALPKSKPRGRWLLTVYSPWRLEGGGVILADWNVDGGVGGPLHSLVQPLVGTRVASAETSPPAWDLAISWSNGMRLLVFGDCTNDRDAAWFILGSGGSKFVAEPIVAPVLSPDQGTGQG